eukprot:219021-Chlamydomonas_euryale.AAC.1
MVYSFIWRASRAFGTPVDAGRSFATSPEVETRWDPHFVTVLASSPHASRLSRRSGTPPLLYSASSFSILPAYRPHAPTTGRQSLRDPTCPLPTHLAAQALEPWPVQAGVLHTC